MESALATAHDGGGSTAPAFVGDSVGAALTSGADGSLWFTESRGNNEEVIGRINTSGTITEFMVPTRSAGTAGITRGPDGNIWAVGSANHKFPSGPAVMPAGLFGTTPVTTSRREAARLPVCARFSRPRRHRAD